MNVARARRMTMTLRSIAGFSLICAASAFAPDSAQAQAVIEPVNVNQHGITGSWYNPQTSGQGFEFEVYPDLNGAGKGLFVAGWYTFDTDVNGGQRWYTLSGPATNSSSASDLEIDTNAGGNFNAPPVFGSSTKVGYGSISFSDCNTATLAYTFLDGSHRQGSIPLQRLTANITCGPVGDSGDPPGDYLLSGAWYEANQRTNGQGFLFDLNPKQNLLAANWYTFAVDGSRNGGPQSQRWFTIQTGNFSPTDKAINNASIYAVTNGVFDTGGGISVDAVGTADISFSSCGAMTLHYSFTSGENIGLLGSINLVRVGPVPAGCDQWYSATH